MQFLRHRAPALLPGLDLVAVECPQGDEKPDDLFLAYLAGPADTMPRQSPDRTGRHQVIVAPPVVKIDVRIQRLQDCRRDQFTPSAQDAGPRRALDHLASAEDNQ